MKQLNKNQIIIIIIIVMIIIYVVGYFFKNKNYNELENNILDYEPVQENNIETKDEVEKIIVYITGAVNKVGVYELEENSRIKDIVEMAEGLKEEADLQKINLAGLLEDGMKIYIPFKGEKENEQSEDNEINNTANVENKKTKININTATQKELETLPGIGEATALKIVNYRKQNGKFSKIEDIKKVSGIGDSKFEKIKDLIKV